MENNNLTTNGQREAAESQERLSDISISSKWLSFFGEHKALITGFLILAAIVAGFFYFRGEDSFTAREFSQVYSLVNEKVSKSAAIIISLPVGVNKAEAMAGVTFNPDVEGRWVETSSGSQLMFKPNKELEVGKYYAVNLATPSSRVSADFLVDEDPRIETIFPASGSETHENSNITIIFNRPMVPLTTLGELDKKDIPIEITPETEGKFKWISTRNLQFIPKERLLRSSSYEVAIGEGLTSVDGLTVEGMTHKFNTRPLRYVNLQKGQLLYNRPISVVFNQPVDLDRTTGEITITKQATNESVSFYTEYGTRTIYNKEKQKDEEFIDRAIVNIYQEKDVHGRKGFWDFKTNYSVSVRAAHPFEGDISLETGRTEIVQVPEIIKSLSAESERSTYVRPNLFDPQGKLVVRFYEDVDLRKSDIEAKGLENIEYGEMCKKDSDGRIIYLGAGGCDKEEDKKTLLVTFKANSLGESEFVDVRFKKIYNTEGFKLNAEIISKEIITYPDFQISKTFPVKESQSASLTNLVVCSNSPIKTRGKEDYKEAITASDYLVFNRWQRPIYRNTESRYYKCAIGEFETVIRYGLLPETDYQLTLKLEDDFGQQDQRNFSFRTTKPDQQYFHIYNMQKVYNVTQPGKTKLTYAVENMEYLNMSICKISPETLLDKLTNRSKTTDVPDYSNCQSVKSDVIQLPKKYWVNNYFQINLEDYFSDTLGHYVVTFSHPDYKAYGGGKRLYDRTYVSVTSLSVGEKKVQWNSDYYRYSRTNKREIGEGLIEPVKNLYWVNHMNNLEPVHGATVSLYSQAPQKKAISLAKTYATDAQGIAQGRVVKDAKGAVIKYLDDSAIVAGWTDSLQYAQTAREAAKTYIYTDRPIYRPGHEVFVRGIDRIGYDGEYEVFREKDAAIKVHDSKGSVIYSQDLPVSEYGTFDTRFIIPSDAPLGYYRIEAFGATTNFSVEEYVPSAFKLEVDSDQEEYIAGDTMKLDVAADYFFGVPLDGGDITYTITSQNYYFDKYTDEYFNFGGGWYSCYSCGYGDTYLLRGKTTLGPDGKGVIEEKIDFNKLYKDPKEEGSKIFVVNATVKDSNGRSVSAQKSFIVHRGEVYLGVKSDKRFLPKNEEFTLRAKSVDTNGEPTSKKDILVEINKISWKSFKRREVDGSFYYKYEKEETSVKRMTISTNRKGDWDKKISLEEEGQYEIKLSTVDSRDNPIFAKTRVYVYGEGQVSIKPTNNYTLEIETDQIDVNVGDKPKIIIKSPYDKAKALITVERGKVFDYWVVDINRNLYDFTVPIKEEYSPNVFVSVLLLSDDPEIKFGQVEFKINREQYNLNVDVKADKTNYLPGETVNLAVKATNYQNQPVQAEVSIAVADLSVLALKGNPKKNPLVFFYSGFPLTVTTGSNIKNVLYELDIPLGTKGGGGGDAEDLAKRKRGIFRDTAFWEANVETGQDGMAYVSFVLPDNLTTWQIESLGITKDTLVGIDYDEIISRKDLMVVPLKPRFIIPGDEFYIGAKIFNQTDKKQKIDIDISSETLELVGDMNQRVSVGSEETDTIYFKVKAPGNMQKGTHVFTLSAKNPMYEDTVENTISITRNDTYEAVATANFTKSDGAREYIYIPDSVLSDKGGLTINTNATMAVFLSDALNYLVSYPYGCSEQLASKLGSIAVVKRGLNIENIGDKFTLDEITFEGKKYSLEEVVKLGLNRIYENQTPRGGFAYYKNMQPSYHLTLHMVQVLEDLKRAGFEVNEPAAYKAKQYLYKTISTDRIFSNNKNLVILTAYTLMRAEDVPNSQKEWFKSQVNKIGRNVRFVNEDINSMSLAYLAILTADGYSSVVKNRVFKSLENRIEVDGRGAYLKGKGTNLWAFYETPIKNTALLLKAITKHEKEHPLLDKILRWLLKSRSKDGAWGSTNNTLAVIDSMVDFLGWQQETKSDFALVGDLDGETLFEFDFNKDTVLETFSEFVPIGGFTVDKTHVLSFTRENRGLLRNNFYYDMSLKYYLPVDKIPPRDEGITISRAFYGLTDEKEEEALSKAKVGDVLKGKITITTPKPYNFVSVEDFIPAGFELVNMDLATEDKTLGKGGFGKINNQDSVRSSGFVSRTLSSAGSFFGTGSKGRNSARINIGFGGPKYLDEYEKPNMTLSPDFKEMHDDRVFLFKERLSPGVYEYEYYVRALVPGTFQHLPAVASEMYFPEIFGRTEGNYFTVTED